MNYFFFYLGGGSHIFDVCTYDTCTYFVDVCKGGCCIKWHISSVNFYGEVNKCFPFFLYNLVHSIAELLIDPWHTLPTDSTEDRISRLLVLYKSPWFLGKGMMTCFPGCLFRLDKKEIKMINCCLNSRLCGNASIINIQFPCDDNYLNGILRSGIAS